ncbi:MAG: hypothetical protein V1921_03955 [Candidatus Altiarchaeota archaeon]
MAGKKKATVRKKKTTKKIIEDTSPAASEDTSPAVSEDAGYYRDMYGDVHQETEEDGYSREEFTPT